MRLCFSIMIFLSATPAFAQSSCPRLEGRFECRGNPPFELSVKDGIQNGAAVYTFSDPTNTQNVIPDGMLHEIQLHDGKGSYVARCEGPKLLVEVHGPGGGVGYDTYYIERAALVRTRIAAGHSESLSCRPIAGTWRLYPH